jgi:hypothetical protein
MKRTQPNLILALPFIGVVGLFAIGVMFVTSVKEISKIATKKQVVPPVKSHQI